MLTLVRRSARTPKLGRHRASGQWRVVLDGTHLYLGHDRIEAERKYREVLASWLATGRVPGDELLDPPRALVGDLTGAFLDAHERYYVGPDGVQTGELENYRDVIKMLLERAAHVAIEDFSPKRFKDVRDAMVQRGWCRPLVNAQARRLKRLFKWGTSEELVPAGVFQALATVEGLRRFRTTAPEPAPILPVPEKDIEAALPHLPPPVAALVQLQLYTGMRVSEALGMRTVDIDRRGTVWLYVPPRHKTLHFGRKRTVALGPKAQEILRPLLQLDPQAPLFSPERWERERYATMRAARKTRVQPSQRRRALERAARARRRIRAAGTVYTVAAYRRAIERACTKAGIDAWAPARLRHNAAERMRREFGVETARCVLGHADIRTTQLYSSMDEAKAIEAAGKLG